MTIYLHGKTTRNVVTSATERGAVLARHIHESPPDHEILRDHLHKVLESRAFGASPRSKRFLEYAVTRHLAGDDEALKESLIAREVFGKVDFDSRIDATVRSAADRLRKQLERYYREDGARDAVVIQLPTGHYIPQFSWSTNSKPSVFKFRWAYSIVIMALAGIAVGTLTAWRLWPLEPELLGSRQLTRDGRAKGRLAYLGGRLYFDELVGNKNVIASVPIAGGNVSLLDLPLTQPRVLSASAARDSVLLTDSTAQLYEMRLKGLALQRLPLPAGVIPDSAWDCATWDPRGQRLAISDRRSSVTVFEPGSVAEPVRLQLPVVLDELSWDAQGRRLRISTHDPKTETTRFWDLNGNERAARPLPHFSPNRVEGGGVWTSDGRFFLFLAGTGSETQIWVSDAQADPPRSYQLTNDARSYQNATTVPDSNTVLALGRQFQGQLIALPSSGQAAPNKLVLPVASGYELDYSRDGQWVAYTRFPEHTIWRSRPDGAQGRQLSPSGIIAHQPHWSPDGTRIAFMGRAPNKHSRIYIVSSSGGSLDLPLPEGDDQGVPTWSSDGRSLVFGDLRPSLGFERAAVHVLDLETQTVSTIAAPVPIWTPRMSPDGKYIAAISSDNKSLYVRDNRQDFWRKCATADFVDEPIWPPDSSWIQYRARPAGEAGALFRVRAACDEPPKSIVELSKYIFVGATWFGISPEGFPLALLATPDEIYALDWRPQRRLP